MQLGGGGGLPVAPTDSIPVVGGGYGEPSVDVPQDQKNFLFYLAIVAYIVSLTFSLVINVAIGFAITKELKIYAKRPFFLFLYQLILANLFSIVSNIYCSVPVALFIPGDKIESFTSTGIYKVFASFENLSDQLVQFLSLLISLHRFCIFLTPKATEAIFHKFSLTIILILVWIISAAVAIYFAVSRCAFSYSSKVQHYEFQCLAFMDESIEKSIFFTYMLQKALFPAISLICYVAIFAKLIQMRSGTNSSSSGEKQILRQAIFIFVVFQIATALTVYTLTTSLTQSVVFLSKRLTSTVELLAGALAPLFVMMTSKEIKSSLRLCSIQCSISITKPTKIGAAMPTSSGTSNRITVRRTT